MCATQQDHVLRLNSIIFLTVSKIIELNQPVYKEGFCGRLENFRSLSVVTSTALHKLSTYPFISLCSAFCQWSVSLP